MPGGLCIFTRTSASLLRGNHEMKKIIFTSILFSVIISCSNYNVALLNHHGDKKEFSAMVDTILKYIPPEMEIYNLKKGDTIADIGIGMGLLEGVCAILYDSITIYAVDINKKALRKIKKVAENFAKMRSKTHTLTIIPVKGSAGATNLAEASVEKLILRNTFHEVEEKEKMLQDIRRVLKDEGTFYLIESYAEKFAFKAECTGTIMTIAEYKDLLLKNGFKIIAEHYLSSNAGYSFPHTSKEQKVGLICFVIKKFTA